MHSSPAQCWASRLATVRSGQPHRARTARRPARRTEGQVRAADFRAAIPPDNPPTRRQGRARQAPVRGPRAVRDRHHRLRVLPRPQARLHRRRAHRQGRHRQAAGAPHADAVERGLEPAAVLGRPRLEPRGPGALSRRAPRRDGLHARERRAPPAPATTATCTRSRKPSRRTRRSRPATSPRRSPPTSARWSRRPTRFDRWVAGDAAALTPSEVNGFAIFTGKGRCINCHTRLCLHRPRLLRHRPAERGSGPRAHRRPPRRRPCLQGADPARAGLDRALHARRLARHARRRRARLRDGRRRPPDAQQGPAARICASPTRSAPTSSPSSRACRATRRPSPRRSPGWQRRAAGTGRRRHATPRSSARSTSCSRRRTSASRPAGRSPSSTTTRAPTTCASTIQRFDFNSGAQEPQETVTIRFPGPGTFEAFCGIHPSMRLTVEVK